MLLKILNHKKLSKFILLFIKHNIDFLKNEFLTRKFYNLDFLASNLF